MIAKDLGPAAAVMQWSPGAAGRWQSGQLAGVEDGDGMTVWQWQAGICGHCGRRGVDDSHGREVVGLVAPVVIMVVVVGGHLRGRLWGAALGHVDDERLGHCLSARKVGVEGAAHVFLRPQCAVLRTGGFSWDNAEGYVGCIKAAAQRVLILFQDHVAHIVDEVVFADLHERGRGIGPLHPDLAVQHVGGDGGGCRCTKIVGRGWGVFGDQRRDEPDIRVGDERLATDGARRGGFGRRCVG